MWTKVPADRLRADGIEGRLQRFSCTFFSFCRLLARLEHRFLLRLPVRGRRYIRVLQPVAERVLVLFPSGPCSGALVCVWSPPYDMCAAARSPCHAPMRKVHTSALAHSVQGPLSQCGTFVPNSS
eukprot:3821710-Pleurochrysis_carterae.AAC.9